MQTAKKGQQKVLILKKLTGLCPSRSYYILYCMCLLNQNRTSSNLYFKESDGLVPREKIFELKLSWHCPLKALMIESLQCNVRQKTGLKIHLGTTVGTSYNVSLKFIFSSFFCLDSLCDLLIWVRGICGGHTADHHLPAQPRVVTGRKDDF